MSSMKQLTKAQLLIMLGDKQELIDMYKSAYNKAIIQRNIAIATIPVLIGIAVQVILSRT